MIEATFQQLLQQAVADPAPIIKEQLALRSDLALLWQRTAARALSQCRGRTRHRAGEAGQAVQERSLDRKSLSSTTRSNPTS